MAPYTTLAPLSIVISVSLVAEFCADIKRHRSDEETNNAECIILRRSDDINRDNGAMRDASIIGGKDVIVKISRNTIRKSSSRSIASIDDASFTKESPHLVQIAFQKIKRMNIRQGHIILIRNRDQVPADTIILASSGENGCAYIETSSIDGETNLKLRNSPAIPSKDQNNEKTTNSSHRDGDVGTFQSLERATKEVTRFSALAYPNGVSCIDQETKQREPKLHTLGGKERSSRALDGDDRSQKEKEGMHFIATLMSEAPNSHVNTFSGKLVLPPFEQDGEFIEIPLGAENILLRGAILRNTEWVIGLSCYTGKDTKLVRNSFETPSKFSRIDVLINKCVILIVMFMLLAIGYVSVMALYIMEERFDELW
jgi:magnesium-transporting ATPase (P-type)